MVFNPLPKCNTIRKKISMYYHEAIVSMLSITSIIKLNNCLAVLYKYFELLMNYFS